jgi:hypothetical protein
MGKKDNKDWLRMILAFVAVLLVAGPGLVLAGSSTPAYPFAKAVLIQGPHRPTAGPGNNYTITIVRSDNSTFPGNSTTPGLTVSSSAGTVTETATGFSFDATGLSSGTLVTLSAQYMAPGSSSVVTGNKVVKVQ